MPAPTSQVLVFSDTLSEWPAAVVSRWCWNRRSCRCSTALPVSLRGVGRTFPAAEKGAGAKAFYGSTGTEAFITTPDELAKFQAAESGKWGRIIKQLGLAPQ